MNAKEFLMRGFNLERHVRNLTNEIEHYRSLVNNCSVTYSDMPKSTTENYKLEDCTQKIIDLQKELMTMKIFWLSDMYFVKPGRRLPKI